MLPLCARYSHDILNTLYKDEFCETIDANFNYSQHVTNISM